MRINTVSAICCLGLYSFECLSAGGAALAFGGILVTKKAINYLPKRDEKTAIIKS